jgi:hypothetical protein
MLEKYSLTSGGKDIRLGEGYIGTVGMQPGRIVLKAIGCGVE